MYDNFRHWKFLEFRQFSKIVEIKKVTNFRNWKFMEYSKLEIYEIFVI